MTEDDGEERPAESNGNAISCRNVRLRSVTKDRRPRIYDTCQLQINLKNLAQFENGLNSYDQTGNLAKFSNPRPSFWAYTSK